MLKNAKRSSRNMQELLPHWYNFSTLHFCKKKRDHIIRIDTLEKATTFDYSYHLQTCRFPLYLLYCMTNQGDHMPFQVILPNGRKVDLQSKKGADEFVDTVGTGFLSTNLAATDDQELQEAYTLMLIVLCNASPEKIASGIPEPELRTLVDHTRHTLDTLSTDRKWLRSGKVSKCHEFLFKVITAFSQHPSFFKIFLSNGGMEAVAKFYASRKMHDTPDNCVAELIQLLVNTTLCVLTEEGLSSEKAFGSIEKTGLLGQFIRCVTVDPKYSIGIVEALQKCLQLVKKKLKSGTPTGDILDAVIAGKDGPINEKAKSGLARLQSLARLSNDNYGSECNVIKTCRRCEKLETQMGNSKLMKCQRCKITYYCSKECQAADWKSHKIMCKEMASGNESRSTFKLESNIRSAFIESNYLEIAKEVYKKTQEYNVPKTELLVEIDFFRDAPALRNEFKVWLMSGFLEGSSVADAPGWFRTQSEKETLALLLKEGYEKLRSDDLLAVCRAGDGNVSTVHLNRPAT
jgi:hypothetical protein